MVTKADLVVPVYLNQRVVFDLVAMLQGGIVSVTHISQSHTQTGSVSAEATAKFGLNRALSSLLNIDLTGRLGGSTSGQSGETRSEQRIHTPASLFIALRALLHERSYINLDSLGANYNPGDIVEFSASLTRNPLREMMGIMLEIMEVALAFADTPKGKKSQGSTEQTTVRQLRSFISSLDTGDFLDLIGGPLQSSHRCVVTLEKEFLNDPTMSDLVDGTFRVVGKVTRVIAEGEGAVSLNRKSAMGKLPGSVRAVFSEMAARPVLADFSLPAMEWEIPGPVIQVLPIAIFV